MLLLLLGCAPTVTDTAPPADTADTQLDPFAQAFVDAHNAARARTEPTPDPPLPELTWDEDLEAIATDWAAGCVFEHSAGETGENLAVYSFAVEPDEVVDYWYSEIASYDYETNTCAQNEQCGHYTQLVWRDTLRVGCAVQSCDAIDGFGSGDLWVCEYDPAGNWMGEWPY